MAKTDVASIVQCLVATRTQNHTTILLASSLTTTILQAVITMTSISMRSQAEVSNNTIGASVLLGTLRTRLSMHDDVRTLAYVSQVFSVVSLEHSLFRNVLASISCTFQL